MIFNLQWESNKQKIAIAISDEDDDDDDDCILIKPDLTNAFSKKIVKKIWKKISIRFKTNSNHEVVVNDESFVQANIDDKVINNVKTLELMLKELLNDIIDELKIKAQRVYA